MRLKYNFVNILGLNDLRFCTRILDEINYSCDGTSVVQTEAGEAYGLDKVALTHVESVTVEHENQVQVSINKVMSYLKQVKYGRGNLEWAKPLFCPVILI